jgi:hypothetical protein
MINKIWLTDLLKETESENTGTEIYNLQQIVLAFEDAMPEYQGLQGKELIAESENVHPEIEIYALTSGLQAMASGINSFQRNEIENSVQVQVMKEVNAELGVNFKL